MTAMLTSVSGQPKVRVRISISAPSRVNVEVTSLTVQEWWSFRNSYANVLGLADRIEEFDATSQEGHKIEVKRLASGEFRAAQGVTNYSYSVNLPAPEAGTMSHVSWLANECGFLMFADLLPSNLGKENGQRNGLLAEFTLPQGWTIGSAVSPDNNRYIVDDPVNSVFLVGRSLRRVGKTVEGMPLELIVEGQWPLADSKVLSAAAGVLKRYAALTRFRLPQKSVVMLAPFPVSKAATQWKAETRGSSVVLLVDPKADFATWVGQFGVIFTHELLHLWIPNSLRLDGDYDWFFEGFTLYEGLQTALDLKLINFGEYLDTLARVYDSYLSYSDDGSLLQASERRWTSSTSLVYDKGMLVAFLYDLIVRLESGGKATLSDCYPPLFSYYRDKPANANEVIMKLLSATPSTRDFPQIYIKNKGRLELEQVLTRFGFKMDSSGPRSRLLVGKVLTKEQRELLRSLGYRR